MKLLLLALLLVASVQSFNFPEIAGKNIDRKGFLSKLVDNVNVNVKDSSEEVKNNIAANAQNKNQEVITNVLQNNLTNVDVTINAAQVAQAAVVANNASHPALQQQNLQGLDVDVNDESEEVKNNIAANLQNKNQEVITNVLQNNLTNVDVTINAAQIAQLADIIALVKENPTLFQNTHRKLAEVNVNDESEEVKNNIAANAQNKNLEIITNVLQNNLTNVEVAINAAQIAQILELIKQNPELIEQFQEKTHRKLSEVNVHDGSEEVKNNIAANAQNKNQEIITNVLQNNLTNVDVTINAAQIAQLAELLNNQQLNNQNNDQVKLQDFNVDVNDESEKVKNNIAANAQNKNQEIITNVLQNNLTNVDVTINAAQIAQLAELAKLIAQ